MSKSGGIAVITGAAGGLGRGLAQAAATLKYRVMLSDIDAARLDAAVGELTAAGYDATGMVADVRDPQAMEALADATEATYGTPSLLINNAGLEALGFSWEIAPAVWQRVMDCNVLGPVNGVRAFAPRMIKAGRAACIANVASVASLGNMPLAAPYMASKHAVLSLSESIKLEFDLLEAPIAVSVILPGAVATGIMHGAVAPDAHPFVVAHHKVMSAMLDEHGINAEVAGLDVLEQILDGQFWVTTDPELVQQLAKQRGAYLGKGATPVLSPAQLALLPGTPDFTSPQRSEL